MERPKLIGLIALFAMMACGLFWASRSTPVAASKAGLLKPSRESKSDLEVSYAGASGVIHGFVSYKSLLALPQVSAMVHNDENFTEMHASNVHITGVQLSQLTRSLKVPPTEDMLMARCTDGYVGQYPAEYVAAHEPILVLTINGVTLTDWARTSANMDPGPYMVSYADFVPAWHVLGHEDRPQVPIFVLQLEYKTQKEVFGPITPPGPVIKDSPEFQGFAMAKQNCLRCHNAGPYGGTKAGWSWDTLSVVAKADPKTFKNYVHDPKSVNANAKMPANPQYDAETLAALTAYFQSLAKK